ncbi:MAG: acetate--CoA ligase family protein [Deltaproteobacteria bacterium]|nr:acetate--CoA ligase family protein [Deltaproteobacteria bacterium]
MHHSIHKLFNPASVAVIGASEVPGKAAERRTRSLIEGGYQGKIFPINPKRDTIFNRKAYQSILDVDEQVDLVMIVVAPRFVQQAVAESLRKGVRGIIIITAGMGETGDEGKRIEKEIQQMVEESDARLLGPNCSGMFSASARVNFLGVPPIQKGPLSILAQSGNIIDTLTYYARSRNLGFSKIVSAGNAVGVKFHEYIEYLNDDPDTGVIMLYLESISDGRQFVTAARETIKRKPIIALKVGRSGAGARAAGSHTGAMAVDDVILDAAFKQAGIIRVFNVDELFDLAMVFSQCPLPKGNRAAILSEGGGDNSVAADNAEKWGVEVPILSEATRQKLRPYLLEGMPACNPIDYGGTAEENPDMIARCCEICMQDDQVDALYVTGFFGGFKDIIAPHVGELEERAARKLVDLVRTHQKPLMVHTSFARAPYRSLEILKTGGVPVFESSDRTAQSIACLMKYVENQRKIKSMTVSQDGGEMPPGVKAILQKAKDEGRKNLLETECRGILMEYAVPLPEAGFATHQNDAVAIADRLGYPVAMKVVSPDIVHKSDVGCVKLALQDSDAVQGAFYEIMENAGKVTGSSRVPGVLISPMARKGQECIIGMTRDPVFGPVIMFGLGGIFVEVLRDVAFRLAPLSNIDIDEMIQEIKGFPILIGIRGEKPKDIPAIQDVLERLSCLVIETPEIKEVDLNPVMVHENGVSIVDSRIILD